MPRPTATMTREAPVFVQTHDMLAWLTSHLEHWPRSQRFFLAREVMDSATELYRWLLVARKVHGPARSQALLEADVRLEVLRGLLRVGQEKQYMSVGQYTHVSAMLAEIGRQIGGWRRLTDTEGS
jgi:hypothetical protein